MSVAVGAPMPAALAEAWVVDAKGGWHLGELVAGRPAVLVFLRHFGCLACSEHVTLLAPRLHELTRLGVAIVYVGNGAPNFIAGFVERNAIDLEKVCVVSDPSLHAFAEAGLRRSFASAFGPLGVLGLARAFVHGFRQSTIEGDSYQQGGVLVIDRDGCVVYAHADRATGDHAPFPDVIEAAMRVAVQDAVVV
jgi:peroxiredoxin